jgi:transposase
MLDRQRDPADLRRFQDSALFQSCRLQAEVSAQFSSVCLSRLETVARKREAQTCQGIEITPLWWTPRKGLLSSEIRQCSKENHTPTHSRKTQYADCSPAVRKNVTEIAKELGVSPSMLHRWRERFEPELTGGALPSQGEREEVERLRSELRDRKAENSLLKKAAALFAKEVK